jgi:hypothetical protein
MDDREAEGTRARSVPTPGKGRKRAGDRERDKSGRNSAQQTEHHKEGGVIRKGTTKLKFPAGHSVASSWMQKRGWCLSRCSGQEGRLSGCVGVRHVGAKRLSSQHLGA